MRRDTSMPPTAPRGGCPTVAFLAFAVVFLAAQLVRWWV